MRWIQSHQKEFFIGVGISIIVIIGLFLLYFRLNSKYIDDYTEEIEDETPEEIQKRQDMELGYELYEEATTIYSLQPYCGLKYEDIKKNRIENINGVKYYRSDYSDISALNNKIREVIENPKIAMTNTIEKDGYIYCKYVKPNASNTYLGEYYLTLLSSDNQKKEYEVVLSYLAPNHTEDCSIETPLDCTNEDKIKEKTKFTIVNVNNSWKVQEFHLYH